MKYSYFSIDGVRVASAYLSAGRIGIEPEALLLIGLRSLVVFMGHHQVGLRPFSSLFFSNSHLV